MHHILRTLRRKGPRVSLGGVDRRSRACGMDRGRVWFFQLPTRLFVVCFRCCSFFSSKKTKASHHKSASSVEIDVEIARSAAACMARMPPAEGLSSAALERRSDGEDAPQPAAARSPGLSPGVAVMSLSLSLHVWRGMRRGVSTTHHRPLPLHHTTLPLPPTTTTIDN